MQPVLAARALACASARPFANARAPAASAPQTPPPPPARGVPPELALDTCQGIARNVGVGVRHSSGEVRLVLAADGAPNRGVQNSALKAKAALAFETPGGQAAGRAKSDAAVAARLAANPTWLAHAGALPITAGGARGSEKDEAGAVAGLDKVRSRLH